ncbi:hypothetical protein HYALB_00001857 [Hymenoscyphus albidus]|uniref:Peptidase A1 domain-containing protein n=1 Tax=Hymenoscyphus albidus TaxID=595503 RepID=A0A9N9LUY5_9HELO|nr:hypothetical protein HYALB_00001857 [Hymenoscyphus albidus]
MHSATRWTWGLIAIVALQTPPVQSAVAPLSVTPSTNWYGYDGSWSAISLRVGTPQQWVDVMVDTVSSETWLIGPGGCPRNNSICIAARGEIYDLRTSSTWQDQGRFNLGVDARLGGKGYADYGLDDVTFDPTGVTLKSTIIGSINTTQYLLGMFGLGIVAGKFQTVTSLPAISGLVENASAIPSHSYGYTAGAKYQQKGVPTSLTLGGYDANRIQPHDITFNLNILQNPQVSVNFISVTSTASSNNWTTPIQLASGADRISAVIDSSTPYLWLPQSVCDRFAQTLGLSFNSSLDLYTFDENSAQHDTLMNSQLSFTFTLSDVGTSPMNINITLPYAAFDLQLSVPFPGLNATYGAPDSTKYYFPIKRATNEAQYTIGRAFLQEAYVITDYERNTFSVHQAIHTTNPILGTNIIAIDRPNNSTFTGPNNSTTSPEGSSKPTRKMAIGAIVGIVVGAAAIIALSILLFFCLRRRKLNPKQPSSEDADEKPTDIEPSSFLGRFRRRHDAPPPPPGVNEAAGSTNYATEVGAGADHERFELAAPLGPAELDSEAGTLSGTTENGSSTTDTSNMSAYERARRKLERQQGSYHNPIHEGYPVEKSQQEDNLAADHTRYLQTPTYSEGHTPLVSPVLESHKSSAQPSPVSPNFTGTAAAGRIGSGTLGTGTLGPTSPPPTYRRLSPGNIVYAGQLSDNVHLPLLPNSPSHNLSTEQQTLLTSPGGTISTDSTFSTLGSHYTEHETVSTNPISVSAVSDIYNISNPNYSNRQLDVSVSSPSLYYNPHSTLPHSPISPSSSDASTSQFAGHQRYEDPSKFLREDMIALRADMQTRETLDPYTGRKRLKGEDLVHVPVPAENRFSFEQERFGGEGTR